MIIFMLHASIFQSLTLIKSDLIQLVLSWTLIVSLVFKDFYIYL